VSEAKIPAEYSVEYEQQLDAWFRSRFGVLCIAYAALLISQLLHFLFFAGGELRSSPEQWHILRVITIALSMVAVIYYALVCRPRLDSRNNMIAVVGQLMLLLGGLSIIGRLVMQPIDPMSVPWGLLDLALLHFIACAILPWTPREAVAPTVALLLIWAVALLVPIPPFVPTPEHQTEILDRFSAVVLSPLILAPGSFIAMHRMRKHHDNVERQMLGKRVRSISGELSRARIVHDAMFPRSFEDGYVAFQYTYKPIQEIGGDYVHIYVDRAAHRIHMTLIDVAGHGLTAALTVNRLFGELERIRAENRDAEPAEVVELLNRYVNLTMAHHDLYATATAIMLNASTGELKWVNAGHPPAIIRRGDGTLIELASTNVLLGALNYAEFEPHQQREKLRPGDVLVAFTDGAFEARNKAGRQFGLEGIRKTLSFTPPPRDWTNFLTTAVEKHHCGMCDDDVLIATLSLQSLRVNVEPTEHDGRATEVDANDPAKSMVK
jgi:hypothetical protein